jgi:hypothetical protein
MLDQSPIGGFNQEHLAFHVGVRHVLGLKPRFFRKTKPMIYVAFLRRQRFLLFYNSIALPAPLI